MNSAAGTSRRIIPRMVSAPRNMSLHDSPQRAQQALGEDVGRAPGRRKAGSRRPPGTRPVGRAACLSTVQTKYCAFGGRIFFLFAGDQRDARPAFDTNNPVVVLAGQEPQGKTDHPRRVAEHPLDREMGLPGIGRPQDGQRPRLPPVRSGRGQHALRIEASMDALQASGAHCGCIPPRGRGCGGGNRTVPPPGGRPGGGRIAARSRTAGAAPMGP